MAGVKPPPPPPPPEPPKERYEITDQGVLRITVPVTGGGEYTKELRLRIRGPDGQIKHLKSREQMEHQVAIWERTGVIRSVYDGVYEAAKKQHRVTHPPTAGGEFRIVFPERAS